jgi:hypothetical protein
MDISQQPEVKQSWNFGFFDLSYTPPSVPKIIKIGDGHFQLCQKVAGLTHNIYIIPPLLRIFF